MTAHPDFSLMKEVYAPAVEDFDTDSWRTPPELYNALDARFKFGFDLAADHDNAKGLLFLDKARDSLKEDWVKLSANHGALWLNPPYSKPNLELFMGKARGAAPHLRAPLVTLVPSTTDSGWWQDYVWAGADLINKARIRTGPLRGTTFTFDATGCLIEVNHLQGRVRYLRGNNKPAGTPTSGSAVVSFLPKRRHP